MSTYSLAHLSDSTLLRDLAALVARDRATTVELLVHLAEVDARKLYLPAAYPSMFAYCVGALRMSEDTAYKRIRAARAARQFPTLYAALADGRLTLTSVVMLTPHLDPDSAEDLLAAAAQKTNAELDRLLAERFPRANLPTQVLALAPSAGCDQLAVRPVATMFPPPHGPSTPGRAESLSPGINASSAPGRIETPVLRPRVTPLAAQSFGVQFAMGQSAYDKLRYAQALLGHQLPSGDISALFERALDALIPQLEKRKFAATKAPQAARPRPGTMRPNASPRHIPAHVKRTVWERDHGQCTFVSQGGRRCPARTRLEFDHVQEVARGGEASVTGIRLRCRAHNQYGAERTFGAEFMRHKGRAAVEMRVAAKAHAAAAARERAAAAELGPKQDVSPDRDVAPWLRQLGFRADEVRRAAALCEAIPDASLEERVRLAVSSLARGGMRRTIPGP